MNRKELVTAVAAHTGLDARDVDKALRGTTEVIEAVAAKGEQVTIVGFAKFARMDRPARNPATGAAVKVKASKKAKITPLKGFKDAVMSPSAAPKLAKGVWPPVAAKLAPAKKGAAPSKSAALSKSAAPLKSAAATSTPSAPKKTPAAADSAKPATKSPTVRTAAAKKR